MSTQNPPRHLPRSAFSFSLEVALGLRALPMKLPHFPSVAALLALLCLCLCTLSASAHSRVRFAPKPLKVSRIRPVQHTRPSVRSARAATRPSRAPARKKPRQIAYPAHRRTAPEPRFTGIAQPPQVDDAATPTPVVSLARPSTERPQLQPIEQVASTPEILPSLYTKRGRLVMPPPMKGSREVLLHQNEVADRDGLERIQDDNDLESMRRSAALVSLPVNAGMQVDERLPFNRRYCRPWAAEFLATLARAHYARFHTPLQVNSAVRTVAFQQQLLRTNGNAAPAGGETASPHLTGQAVDLAKHGLSQSEIAWLRGYLLPLVQEGKIDVEEEFQQACFHISIYKSYLPPTSLPGRNIATSYRDRPAALAIAVP